MVKRGGVGDVVELPPHLAPTGDTEGDPDRVVNRRGVDVKVPPPPPLPPPPMEGLPPLAAVAEVSGVAVEAAPPLCGERVGVIEGGGGVFVAVPLAPEDEGDPVRDAAGRERVKLGVNVRLWVGEAVVEVVLVGVREGLWVLVVKAVVATVTFIGALVLLP